MPVTIVCKHCDKPFTVIPSHANQEFCSHRCYHEWRTGRSLVDEQCAHCGKTFKREPWRERKYCNRKCWKAAMDTANVRRICPGCGKEFWHNQSWPVYHCSQECQAKAAKELVACETCGKEFESHKTQRRKYCSLSCAAQINAPQNAGGNPPVDVTCDNCGKSFQKKYAEYIKTTNHFCSHSCFGEWQSRNKVGENNSRYSRVERTCKYCGETFLAMPSWIKRGWAQFCNRACQAKWKEVNLAGPNNPNWQGGYTPYYGPNWDSQRRKARNRAKHRCEHCGISEKKLGRQLDVHHLEPFRLFDGDHKQANQLSNLISLCNQCHILAEHGKIAVQPHLL